jgi:acyl-homoserine-lactone acylase
MRSVSIRHARTRLFAAGLALALVVLTGQTRLGAAPAKGTEILWDTWGIPHISAPDHPSLFFAYGYAQMEAHSELLLRLYAQARGRGAEIYGEQYLAADRWVHQRHSRTRRSGPKHRVRSLAR